MLKPFPEHTHNTHILYICACVYTHTHTQTHTHESVRFYGEDHFSLSNCNNLHKQIQSLFEFHPENTKKQILVVADVYRLM